MHRSASASRASDEFLINLSPMSSSKGSPAMKAVEIDNIQMYNNHPISDASKKENLKSSGENIIHLIPLLVIFCVLTLWVFSHPVADLTVKNGSIVQIEGLNAQNNDDQSSTQSTMKPKDSDQLPQIRDVRAKRFS